MGAPPSGACICRGCGPCSYRGVGGTERSRHVLRQLFHPVRTTISATPSSAVCVRTGAVLDGLPSGVVGSRYRYDLPNRFNVDLLQLPRSVDQLSVDLEYQVRTLRDSGRVRAAH
jgi:hypothetical protein